MVYPGRLTPDPALRGARLAQLLIVVFGFSIPSTALTRLARRLQIREAAEELGYQADDMFCLKISQLREIFVVRWSVFLLGPAGCGKTAIWKTLLREQQMFGE